MIKVCANNMVQARATAGGMLMSRTSPRISRPVKSQSNFKSISIVNVKLKNLFSFFFFLKFQNKNWI